MNKTNTALEGILEEPSKWDWVQNELAHYIIQKNYIDISPHEAFVKKRIGTLAGDIYRLYVNSTRSKDLQKYLECHEAGHIIFGHVTNETTKDKINKFKIKAAWPQVKDRFSDEKEWENKFDSIIYNIVEDMEVNSKIFTKEEWPAFSQKIGGGIWPEDFSYPIGLDYNTYLNLVLRDPNKFLDNLQNEMDNQDQNQEGNGQGESQPSDEESNQEGQNSQSSKGQVKQLDMNKKAEESAEEAKADKQKNDADGNEAATPSDKDEDQEEDGKSNGTYEGKEVRTGSKLSEEQLQKLSDYAEAHDEKATDKLLEALEPDSNFKTGSSPSGSNTFEIQSKEKVTFNNLLKTLQKLLMKSVTQSSRDILYNYNRNKNNSNVLIPRVNSRESYTPACLYVLLDVSGSISTMAVSNFCAAFQKIARKLNRKSRIILWNTNLVSDFSVKDNIIPRAGGGTLMAEGMRYIQKTYSPSAKDVFFLVSDFQDYLDDWEVALKDMSCQKKAFIFSSSSSENECDSDYLAMQEYIKTLKDNSELLKLWKETRPIDIIEN